MEESEFDVLLGEETRTGTYEETSKFTYSKTLLHNHNVLTTDIKQWMKSKSLEEEDIKFLKNQKALKHRVAAAFTKMEKWFVTHVLKGKFKNEPGKKDHMHKLLMNDPVGVMEPDKNDPFCWTKSTVVAPAEDGPADDTSEGADAPVTRSAASASATDTTAATTQPTPLVTKTEHRQTDFQINLKHFQRSIYLHLRATITARFSDKDSKTLIEGFINDKETESVENNDMNDENRFHVSLRVSWNDIKEFIYDKLCIVRMGSHHFLSIFTTMRTDNETVIGWVRAMEKLHAKVAEQSVPWKTIVDEEIVPAIVV